MSDVAAAHVFHAYDIRGLSPEEIDEAFARRLARALIQVFHPKSILVGRDMRTTSTMLETAFVDECLTHGVDILSIGLCSTPLFNVSVALRQGSVDLGVMMTASHNPAAYNGFKMVRGNMRPIGQGSGMEELQTAFMKDEVLDKSTSSGQRSEDPEALSHYFDHVFKIAALPQDMPPIKIAIDNGNGMGGAVLPALIKRLPWLDVVPLYFDLDGSFPHHEANPLKRETLADVSRAVVAEKCALGLALDGDADRVGLIDEQGEPVPGDIVGILLAHELLKQTPAGLMLYDLRSSWSVPEAVTEAGGRATMCRVGHSYIKKQMREEGAIFAAEVSMHYYFRELEYVESGDLVLLLILKMLSETKRPLSELWKKWKRYEHSGEINFTVTDTGAVLDRLKERYASQATTVTEMDGLRLEFCDSDHPEHAWWFSVRRSNTEPLVRLNLEAKTLVLMEEKKKELSALIQT